MHLPQQVGVKCWWGKGHFGREECEGFAYVGCYLGRNGDSVHSGQIDQVLAAPLGYTTHFGHSLARSSHQQDAGVLTSAAGGNSRALISKSEIICLLQREPKLTELKVLHPVLVDMYLVSSTTVPLCACLYFLSHFICYTLTQTIRE